MAFLSCTVVRFYDSVTKNKVSFVCTCELLCVLSALVSERRVTIISTRQAYQSWVFIFPKVIFPKMVPSTFVIVQEKKDPVTIG